MIFGAGMIHQPPFSAVTRYFAPLRVPRMQTRPLSSAFTKVVSMWEYSHLPGHCQRLFTTRLFTRSGLNGLAHRPEKRAHLLPVGSGFMGGKLEPAHAGCYGYL